MRRLIEEAAARGADVAHFGECVLSGYCRANFPSWTGYDWVALRRETEAVLDACRRHSIWTVFGSSHPLADGTPPHNCVYVVDRDGELRDRYDKRCCSVNDLNGYTPGDHLVTFEVNGVKCACLICLEWGFPEMFQAYAAMGVDLVFHSAYSAGRAKDSIFTHIVPPMMQGHAANHQLFISLANVANPIQDFPSLWIRRSGRPGSTCERSMTGMTLNAIANEPDKDEFYAMVRRFRGQVRDGVLYESRMTDHPRSRDRRSL